MKKLLLALLLIQISFSGFSQLRNSRSFQSTQPGDGLDYLSPKEYVIGGIKMNGLKHLDESILLTISRLTVGDRILVPGDATSAAVKNLWDQQLFENVELAVSKIEGETIYLEFNLVEIPRVSRIELKGLSKSETTDVKEKLDKQKSKVVNENLNKTITEVVKKHFFDKGYLNTDVQITYQADSSDANSKIVNVKVDKNN